MYLLEATALQLLFFALGFLPIWGLLIINLENIYLVFCLNFILIGLSIFFFRLAALAFDDPHLFIGCKYPKNKSRINPCEELLECEICHKKIIFGSHDFSVLYLSPDSNWSIFDLVKKCGKCGYEEKIVL